MSKRLADIAIDARAAASGRPEHDPTLAAGRVVVTSIGVPPCP